MKNRVEILFLGSYYLYKSAITSGLFALRMKMIYFQFILTAAHCVAWGREILNAKIVVGAHHLGVKNAKITEHRVRRVKVSLIYYVSTCRFLCVRGWKFLLVFSKVEKI